jgi:RNase H-like domain found in reverse transcriptase
MMDAKVAEVKKARIPKTKTQLRAFLRLANLYRRFMKDFAKIAHPSTEITKAELPAHLPEFTPEATAAFSRLKERLTNPPTSMLPRYDAEFVLDTGASNEQSACVLQQKNENTGRLHPVGFWSRALSPAEKKYSTVEKEGLAITGAVKTLRPYLDGKHFRISHRFRGFSRLLPLITRAWPGSV